VADRRLNLPNLITVLRIVACPAIVWLALSRDPWLGLWAFVLFLVAALSDLWDGYLARKNEQITDVGKLLDPLADKLLLAATFIPFYLISHRADAGWELPFWGALPLWVIIVIFGREIFMTVFRGFAVRRGVVIAAGKAGKYKAFIQNLFSGGVLLWYPLIAFAAAGSWSSGFWTFWRGLHSVWIGAMLLAAIILTVGSMFGYLWNNRTLFVGGANAP